MNIVVFNGSPNKKGNTAALVNAFAKGAKDAGHHVEIFQVGRMHIDGCYACDYCVRMGRNGDCCKKDEMHDIYPSLAEADMLVIASPIYYFAWSAQASAAMQRIYAFGKLPKASKMALLLSSYSPDVYDGSIATYKSICNYLGLEDMGIITAHGEENKSEEKLAAAQALGASL